MPRQPAVRALLTVTTVAVAVLTASAAASASSRGGLSASTNLPQSAPKQPLEVTGNGWPAGALLNATTCGDDALSPATDCDQTRSFQTVATKAGAFQTRIVVGRPPVGCPCVIDVTAVNNPNLSVAIPFKVVGDKSAPGAAPSTAVGSVSLVHAQVFGSGPWLSWFGAGAHRTLIYTVHNGGTASVSRTSIQVGLHGIDQDNPTVTIPPGPPIPAGATATIDVPLPLGFGSLGGYTVAANLGGQAAFTGHTSDWPWALFVLMAAGVLLSFTGIRRRLRDRRAVSALDAADHDDARGLAEGWSELAGSLAEDESGRIYADPLRTRAALDELILDGGPASPVAYVVGRLGCPKGRAGNQCVPDRLRTASRSAFCPGPRPLPDLRRRGRADGILAGSPTPAQLLPQESASAVELTHDRVETAEFTAVPRRTANRRVAKSGPRSAAGALDRLRTGADGRGEVASDAVIDVQALLRVLPDPPVPAGHETSPEKEVAPDAVVNLDALDGVLRRTSSRSGHR